MFALFNVNKLRVKVKSSIIRLWW